MITITGTNFGPAQLTTMMPSYLGKITGSYKNNIGYQYSTMSGEDCKVTIDHTQMTCTSVAGVGKDFKWRLTVASQTSAESTVTTRYRKPEIYSLDGPGAFEANTAGNTIANNDNTQGEKYYLRGNYFGPATKGTFPKNGDNPIVQKLGHVDLEQFWSRDEGYVYLNLNYCFRYHQIFILSKLTYITILLFHGLFFFDYKHKTFHFNSVVFVVFLIVYLLKI
jgi:hypothetical protein